MPESKMYKNDTKSFDKKVWEGNEASSRKRQVQKYSINCSKCGKEYIITNLSQVYKDPDSGEYVYTCDNCIPRPAN